jgi:hypothetical protein
MWVIFLGGVKAIIEVQAAFPLAGWRLMRVNVEAAEFGKGIRLRQPWGNGRY